MAERTGNKQLVKGNEALAEGAVQAGCKCYFGYPITPQNAVPEYLSWRLPEMGGTFLQAESEVASINMVLGAALTGARVMTSSSSPGISLMQEGISFLAGDELPAVIVNMQRCGPGLGGIQPTQGDYFQATRGGGHGDYRTLVLAPVSVQELFDFTYLAFDLADKYRNPVLVLGDAILGQMKEPAILEPDHPREEPDKSGWALTGAKDGRPLRNIRSMHLGEGVQEQLNYTLREKYDRMERDEVRYDERWCDDADCAIIAFGTAARIAICAIHEAREEGIKVGLFRPQTLYPFPTDAIRSLSERVKRLLVLELNTGQMVEDVRAAVGERAAVGFHGRPAGGLPSVAEVLAKIEEL